MYSHYPDNLREKTYENRGVYRHLGVLSRGGVLPSLGGSRGPSRRLTPR